MGRAMGNAMINLGIEDTAAAALYDLGMELEELGESGTRGWSRQRRPGSSRGVFSGFHGHVGASRIRVRHPLRLRHVPPENPQRVSGGAPGQLAATDQSVGDFAPRIHRADSLQGTRGGAKNDHGADRVRLGGDRRCAGLSLRHAHSRIRQPDGEHVAVVVRKIHATNSG